jgi:hypothetical protein
MFQLVLRIRDWTHQIIRSLPPVPVRTKKIDLQTAVYLSTRKRVFTDFAVAADKVIRAFRISGPFLSFQLEAEVLTLFRITFHEVQELLDFLSELTKRFPEIQETYSFLMENLARINAEMIPFSNSNG